MGHAIDSQRKIASVLKELPDDLQNRVARFCDDWEISPKRKHVVEKQ
jgi:hypothetical protein